MASPILHPRLGAAVGEGDGDEGRAGVVEADGAPGGALLEELGAGDACGAEVLAEAGRASLGDGAAKLVGEDGIVVGEPAAGDGLAEGVPGAEGSHDARREGPCARVVGLVLVERDRASVEVDIAPGEGDGLAGTGAFAVQVAVEDAPAEMDGRRCEEARVLVGVEPTLCLGGPLVGHEAAGERTGREEAQREDRDGDHAVHGLRDLAARDRLEGGREGAHDGFGVVEREVRDEDVADHRDDVVLEVRDVRLDAALALDVVGVLGGQLAAGPAPGELGEGDRGLRGCGALLGYGLAAAEGVSGPEDGVESLALPGRRALEEPAGDVGGGVLAGPEPGSERGQDGETVAGLGLGRACLQDEARPLVGADGHAGEPAPAALVDVPGRLARHGECSLRFAGHGPRCKPLGKMIAGARHLRNARCPHRRMRA